MSEHTHAYTHCVVLYIKTERVLKDVGGGKGGGCDDLNGH